MNESNMLPMLALLAPLNATELSPQEYFAPVVSQQVDAYSAFEDLNVYSRPVSVSSESQKILKFLGKLRTIKSLNNNWDGNNATKVEQIVIDNTVNFLRKIPDFLIVEKGESEISIEIGDSEISYFSELGSESFEQENITISENQIFADEIIQGLQKVFR